MAEHEGMKNSCPRGLLIVVWIQTRPPVSFSPPTLTSAQNVIIPRRRLEENPLGFRRRQRYGEKPLYQYEVSIMRIIILFCKELWDFITWFLSVMIERCVLWANRRKQALKSFPCCLAFLLPRETPQGRRRFWPDWPLSASQTSGEPDSCPHFIGIHSIRFSSVAKNQDISASYWTRGLEDPWEGRRKTHANVPSHEAKAAFWPLPLSPKEKPPSISDHVNGPLQYLMFLYGVLTIECRKGMHIWLLGRVRIHLPNRAMHSDVEWEGLMKARANSGAKPALFYPRWTQALKWGWGICLH